MNNVIKVIKDLFYALPFGLKGADSEIMGTGDSTGSNDVSIKKHVQDNRVAKHLLKGAVTKEVEELRYRTYKVDRETDKYDYIGNGLAVKKDIKKASDVIKFSQPNKLICNDILTELKHVNNYGIERYLVEIDYTSPVKIKLEPFLTLVDVYIKSGENAVTTLHFNDIMNPSDFKSKPFVNALKKLFDDFSKNDTYAISRNEYATSLFCMNFTTFNANDGEPNVVNYSFTMPDLIAVQHDNGEYLLKYQWKLYSRNDLSDKFFNPELEEKYKKKEKKETSAEAISIEEVAEDWWKKHEHTHIKCHVCNKDIDVYKEGYIVDEKTGEPVCLECYKKSLLTLI